MAARRLNPNRVKMHRSYNAHELATLLNVHKNTVRQWQRDGLQALDSSRPALFHGETARIFLRKRNSGRKRPCLPGTIYCFRCRMARAPAGAMADYEPRTAASGNLKAICEACETIMYRRIRQADIAAKMPNIEVRIMDAAPRLVGEPSPSLNCDLERQAQS